MRPQKSEKGSSGIHVALALLIILTAAAWGASWYALSSERDSQQDTEGTVSQNQAQAALYDDQKPIEEYRMEGVSYQIPLNGAPSGSSQAPAPSSQPAQNQTFLSGDYILPDVSTRFYSQSELAGLSKQQLYLARNEIYARLGRKFKNADLDRYFRAKSWYQPLYEPDAFDAKGDGVFNQYELANRNLIVEIERTMN